MPRSSFVLGSMSAGGGLDDAPVSRDEQAARTAAARDRALEMAARRDDDSFVYTPLQTGGTYEKEAHFQAALKQYCLQQHDSVSLAERSYLRKRRNRHHAGEAAGSIVPPAAKLGARGAFVAILNKQAAQRLQDVAHLTRPALRRSIER